MYRKLHLIFVLAAIGAPVNNATADLDVPADFVTIQEAIIAAEPGETINVAPGVYRENLDLLRKTIQLIGTGGASVTTLDGVTGPVVDAFLANSEIAGFTITGQTAPFGGAAIDVSAGTTWIHDNIIEYNQGSVGPIKTSGAVATIERNIIRYNSCGLQSGGGVQMTNPGTYVVRNNVFHDNACAGVDVNTPTDIDVDIANNTFYRNRAGILHSTFVSSTGQRFTNNILIGNETGLMNTGQSSFSWQNNLVWENDVDYSGYTDPTGLDGNLNADPLLTDPDNGDFHILAGSPAIETGLAVAVVTDDFDRQLRPIDGDMDGDAGWDIGADEYSQSFGPFPADTTVYVAASNPEPGSGSLQNPFRDIQTAIDAAGADDVVGVASGDYVGQVTMKPRVDLVGMGPDATSIDALAASGVIVCGDQARLEGFTIRGAQFEPAIDCTNGAGMLIKGNLLTNNNARAIRLLDSISTIIDNEIRAGVADGNIEREDAIVAIDSLVTIENNHIDATEEFSGIQAIDVSFNSSNPGHGYLVEGNTIIGGIRVGGAFANTSAGAAIIGNLFLPASNFGGGVGISIPEFGTILNNTFIEQDLSLSQDSTGTVVNNIFFDATISNCGNENNYYGNNNFFSPTGQRGCTPVAMGENGNVSTDPLFIDPALGDYRLQDASPMINAGDTDAPGLSILDLDGLPRIAGGGVDIGVYEFQGFDLDGDQVFDYVDNCTVVSNPDQTDSDADGFGNRCDPDLNNDGVVNFLDLAAIDDVFFTVEGDPGFDPAADFNVDLGINFADLLIMRNYIFGAPGPAGIQ